MAKYRVLSLDGGGPWAVIQVKALMDLFGAGASGWDVLRQFDMVAANSAGSIVLGCLVEDLVLDDIVQNLFFSQAVLLSIFSKTSSVEDKMLEAIAHIGPKYSAERKLPALQAALPGQGSKVLGDAISGVLCHSGTGVPVHLLIVGFDYDRCKAKFFRSAPASSVDYGTGAPTTLTLAEAIHASTNAPVNYFDGPANYLDNPGNYWDGAIGGFNNPVLAGVTEAIALGKDPGDVIALSLGTGTVALPWPTTEKGSPYVQQPSKTGLLNDLAKLAGSILDDPPDLATFVAHVLTGGSAGVPVAAGSRVVRMNPLVSPMKDPASGLWTAPAGFTTAQQFLDFAKIPMDAIDPTQVTAIADYAQSWLTDQTYNQPIRMDTDALEREIGQLYYSGAKAAWNAISAL